MKNLRNFPYRKLDMMLGAKLTHKRFIPIGFFSPQMMVEMAGTDRDGKLLLQLPQQGEQCARICSTGKRDHNVISLLYHLVLLYGL